MEVTLMTLKPKPLTEYERIHTYKVSRRKSGKSSIRVWTEKNNTCVWADLSDISTLTMVDLLRNEKPVWVHIDSKTLEVSAEPVGAGDEDWQT